MAHRKSKGSHKKHKSKKHREKKNIDNIYTIEEENVKKIGGEVYGEAIMQKLMLVIYILMKMQLKLHQIQEHKPILQIVLIILILIMTVVILMLI